jgi:putative toxin-antitoxin system antitoxin component (TIGR02293 family)
MAVLPLANGQIAARFFRMSLDTLERIYRSPGPIQVERLNKGVSASVFRTLARSMDLSVKSLAESLGLSERTIRYRISRAPAGKKGPHVHVRNLTGDETERSYRAYMVFRRAKCVLGNAVNARVWMQTEQRALGKKTPLSMLVRDVGAGTVLNLLGAIEDGAYL